MWNEVPEIVSNVPFKRHFMKTTHPLFLLTALKDHVPDEKRHSYQT
jgi:hypothetical protein